MTKSMDNCTMRLMSYMVIDRVTRDCKATASYQRHVWVQKCAAAQPDRRDAAIALTSSAVADWCPCR